MTSPCCGFSFAAAGTMMPPGGFFFDLDALDDGAIVKGAESHFIPPSAGFGLS
jgi:hypothetical protein